MSTETPKLDPQPFWICFNGVKDYRTNKYVTRFINGWGEVVVREFDPRPEYSQNREDYS